MEVPGSAHVRSDVVLGVVVLLRWFHSNQQFYTCCSHNVVGIALIKNIENSDDVSYRLAQSISEHAGTANEG